MMWVAVHCGEHFFWSNAALDGAVLVHVHLRPLHFVDQPLQTPHQQITALQYKKIKNGRICLRAHLSVVPKSST